MQAREARRVDIPKEGNKKRNRNRNRNKPFTPERQNFETLGNKKELPIMKKKKKMKKQEKGSEEKKKGCYHFDISTCQLPSRTLLR